MQAIFDTVIFRKISEVVWFVAGSKACELLPSTTLSDDLALGRFGRMRLAVGLEEAFGVEVENEDVLAFTVISDIVEYFSTRYFRDVESASAD